MPTDGYIELWRRLDRVVSEFSRRGDAATADYLAVGFFLNYAEPSELLRFVEIAEASLSDVDGEPDRGRPG